jgi:hypothetical protein
MRRARFRAAMISENVGHQRHPFPRAARRAVLGFQFKVVPLKIERDALEVGHSQQA